MITIQQKRKIKAVLGHRYAPLVQDYCNEFNIRNKDGSKVKTAMIRKVFNNYLEHEVLENAIINCAICYADSQNIAFAKKKSYRDKMLGIKKAVAGTTA